MNNRQMVDPAINVLEIRPPLSGGDLEAVTEFCRMDHRGPDYQGKGLLLTTTTEGSILNAQGERVPLYSYEYRSPWLVSTDGARLELDEYNETYNLAEWAAYILANVLLPLGHTLHGYIFDREEQYAPGAGTAAIVTGQAVIARFFDPEAQVKLLCDRLARNGRPEEVISAAPPNWTPPENARTLR